MKKVGRELNRIGALALAVVLMGTSIDFPILAAGNCEHHTEHTAECGYEEAVEGTPYFFTCDDCASEEYAQENEEQQDEEEQNEEAEVEKTTECTCETDDPAFHATNCPAYIAPENPQCYCAEKCTEDTLNVWCDVCGMQGDNAETDNATDTTDVSDPLVMASKDADSAWWIILLIAVLAVAGIAGFVIYSKKNESE